METRDVLLRRRSIRKYSDEPLTSEEIDELMHAAMAGPSAVNKTPWEFYVVANERKLEELRSTTRFTNIKAPLAIVVCGNLSRALPLQLSDFWIQDCSAASENILLRATDMGLGSLWCGIYPQKSAVRKVREILDIPERHVPLNIIYVGHPLEEKEARDQYKEKCIHLID